MMGNLAFGDKQLFNLSYSHNLEVIILKKIVHCIFKLVDYKISDRLINIE